MLLKDHRSVDSVGSSATVGPLGFSSVQSASGSSFDTLDGAMEKFVRIRQPVNDGKEAKIKRALISLISKNNQAEMSDLFNQWNSSRKSTSKTFLSPNLGVPSHMIKPNVPPANLLRPPRGNLIASTKDLYRELLLIRRLPRSERSGVSARLIRTLDPSCPTHSDIAYALFMISTL